MAEWDHLRKLPLDERIEIAQMLWDSIAAEDPVEDLTEEEKSELDRRIAELDANPENVLTWEQIKASVQKKR
jgi:putative addiction module component (TIGR02574 family)